MQIQILCIVGIILSLYLLYVRQSNHPAFCDINKTISCSAVTKSSFGKLFGTENTKLGIIFYVLIFILAIYDMYLVMAVASLMASIVSIYLLYVMAFKIKKYCVICIIADLINIGILFMSISSLH